MSADAIQQAAAVVNVIDAAGAIIADPRRKATAASTATVLALAHATERFWEVAIEAEILVNAIALPETGNAASDAAKDHAIQVQCDRISQLMAAIRGETPKE